MQSLNDLMQKLAQTGQRLNDLEGKVARIRGRLRFWQIAAAIGIGAAIVLFLAWHGAHKRLEACESRNKLAA